MQKMALISRDEMMPLTKQETQNLRNIQQINWSTWDPVDVATLLFIIHEDKILLIRKRRGLGKGKINAPGGRLEEGETILQAAIREVEEEVCVTPIEPIYRGENLFQFTDGYSLHVHVYTSTDFTGEPKQTEEAIPLWFPINEIPYSEMWEDDQYWIPLMLNKQKFRGLYIFAGDDMLDQDIQVILN
jgi:8-oxo-dGTP diphosphatase